MSPVPVNSKKNAVMVFMRAPELGKVKTRWIPHLSPPVALELYKCLVTDTLKTLSSAGFATTLWVCPPQGAQTVSAWLKGGHETQPQKGEDLGARMADAFRRIFSFGVSRALLVGTDIPDLPEVIYREAFDALADHPAVIGPALDGGYYLIGFNKNTFLPEIFEQVAWGTDRVFDQTRQVFARRGLRPHLLPAWRDLDTYEDLVAFARQTGQTAQTTRAFLRRIGFPPGITNSS